MPRYGLGMQAANIAVCSVCKSLPKIQNSADVKIGQMELCYVCDREVVWKCPTCGSKCCSRHLKKIHRPRCMIGNSERRSRADFQMSRHPE